jgi:hypothetical protein
MTPAPTRPEPTPEEQAPKKNNTAACISCCARCLNGPERLCGPRPISPIRKTLWVMLLLCEYAIGLVVLLFLVIGFYLRRRKINGLGSCHTFWNSQ